MHAKKGIEGAPSWRLARHSNLGGLASSLRACDVCTEQTEARPSRTARRGSHVVRARCLGNGYNEYLVPREYLQ